MIRSILLVLLCSVLVGCASTNLPPMTAADYHQLPEEERIWRTSEQEQQRLAASEMLFEDAELTAYLNQVAMAVLPEAAKKQVTVQVLTINNPYSSAFAYPNGKVYVHTGILARMENEAQLAILLGHEMAHVTQRHAARERRSTLNKAAGLASFNATFGSLPLVGELSSALGALGTMAAVSGYSKGLETDADNIGFEWAAAAGYDLRESPRLFEHLIADLEEEGVEEPFFFGSHPKLKDRHANYKSLLAARGPGSGGKVNREIYEKKVGPAIYETASLDLKAGRFSKAEKGILRYLNSYPKSSRAYFLLGEVYRQRNETDDYKKAIQHLSRASQLDREHADSHRSLGLVHMNLNDKTAARQAFQKYLKLTPKADDRSFIEEYLKQLK
jgi:beta-barrel assembly-enhancing protease